MLIPGNISLFEGIVSSDIEHLLSCLSVRYRSFLKGNVVISEGDFVDFIGVVVSGSIQIVRDNFDGIRMIQAVLGIGALFAESFVCAGVEQSPVSVITAEDSEIMFIPYKKMLYTCKKACSFHTLLIENMMKVIAQKNLMLNTKLDILSKRSIKDRIITFLKREKQKGKGDTFKITLNRNELADFLCVDRSALSRELSKLQQEGLISFDRNKFSLH